MALDLAKVRVGVETVLDKLRQGEVAAYCKAMTELYFYLNQNYVDVKGHRQKITPELMAEDSELQAALEGLSIPNDRMRQAILAAAQELAGDLEELTYSPATCPDDAFPMLVQSRALVNMSSCLSAMLQESGVDRVHIDTEELDRVQQQLVEVEQQRAELSSQYQLRAFSEDDSLPAEINQKINEINSRLNELHQLEKALRHKNISIKEAHHVSLTSSEDYKEFLSVASRELSKARKQFAQTLSEAAQEQKTIIQFYFNAEHDGFDSPLTFEVETVNPQFADIIQRIRALTRSFNQLSEQQTKLPHIQNLTLVLSQCRSQLRTAMRGSAEEQVKWLANADQTLAIIETHQAIATTRKDFSTELDRISSEHKSDSRVRQSQRELLKSGIDFCEAAEHHLVESLTQTPKEQTQTLERVQKSFTMQTQVMADVAQKQEHPSRMKRFLDRIKRVASKLPKINFQRFSSTTANYLRGIAQQSPACMMFSPKRPIVGAPPKVEHSSDIVDEPPRSPATPAV